MHKRNYFAGMLAVIVGFFVALALIAEFVIIPYAAGMPRDILLFGHAAKPGAVIDGEVINSMGFVNDVVSNPKPEGTIRILILGGSVMFNRHLGSRLKQELQKHTSHPIELLNAGLRAHNSKNDLYKMRHLSNLKFDYILYYNGINDLVGYRLQTENHQNEYSVSGPAHIWNSIMEWSLIARYIHIMYYTEVSRENTGRENDPSNSNPFVFFKKNIESISAISKANGSKLILMTFAYSIPENYSDAIFMEGKLDYKNPDNYDKIPLGLWGDPVYVMGSLIKINQLIKEVAEQKNIPLVDIDRELSGKIHLFGDPCHFNDDGVDEFVRIVTQRFLAERWLAGSGKDN